MTNVTKGLQEIWQLGCAGEALTPPEAKHFSDLAASRFHTFILSGVEIRYQINWRFPSLLSTGAYTLTVNS